MTQSAFDFTAIAPSSSPLAQHCSSLGSLKAEEKAGRQALAILALYKARGPLTDQQVADALGIQRNSVNARRAGLMKVGLVQAIGTVKNAQTGISNTTWGLA